MAFDVRILDAQIRDENSRLMQLGDDVTFSDWPCPICGLDDRLLSVSQCINSVATSLCCRCKHFFFSRRPPLQWFQNYYRADWCRGKVHGAGTLPRGRRLAGALRGVARRVLRRGAPPLPDAVAQFDFCRPYLRQVRRVLEVGAGSGRYLLPFQRHGFDCFAIEPSTAAAEACRARGISVLDSFIEHAMVERYPAVELLTTNHSVEHQYDPNVFMSFAARLLRPGGRLCFTVPNHDALLLWTECLFILHVHSFTQRSLTRLLRRYGFRVLSRQIDDQLRFMAERTADGAPQEDCDPEPELNPADRAGAYARRFVETVLECKDGADPSGVYALSYEVAALPYTPARGRYRVRVAPAPPTSRRLSADQAPCLRSMLLSVRQTDAATPVLSIAAGDGGAPPVFVK